MSCPYANPSPKALDTDSFHRLHRDGKQLISAWFARAYRAIDCEAEQSFEPFIFTWIAFNAWGSCVTGQDRDKELVRRVANCPCLRGKFMNLVNDDESFRSILRSFADSWPIFKAQDIRKEGYFGAISRDRDEVIQHYRGIPDVSFEPSCAFFHKENSGTIPVDWPHCLHTIYRVRCNLFHGEKSPHSEMDARIVKGAFDVLVRFLANAEIIPHYQ